MTVKTKGGMEGRIGKLTTNRIGKVTKSRCYGEVIIIVIIIYILLYNIYILLYYNN